MKFEGENGMQMFVVVLNKVERLEDLLEEMGKEGLAGATVLNSRGMAHILCDEDTPMFGVLRSLLNPEHKESKTIFAILTDEQVEIAKKIVRRVTGGLDKPDTGIMFSIPTLFVEGVNENHA